VTSLAVRRALVADAAAIGALHVATWRSTYPGILPESYLARLSAAKEAASYAAAIRAGEGVFVAIGGEKQHIVGFTTTGRARPDAPAQGEIQTLYVLDDFRDQGVGRRLMARAATHLAGLGCADAFLWVLRDNPSRWFYAHLGGRAVQEKTVGWAGVTLVQTAYVWSPIDLLLRAVGDT
jgi:ribosomal protein S18 acetylase RimI-like enzyme